MKAIDIIMSFKLKDGSSIDPDTLANDIKEILSMQPDFMQIECNIRVEDL